MKNHFPNTKSYVNSSCKTKQLSRGRGFESQRHIPNSKLLQCNLKFFKNKTMVVATVDRAVVSETREPEF